MRRIADFIKQNVFVFVVSVLLIIGLIIYFYLETTPGTNNAFVAARIRPVSSQVAGLVDKI